MENKSKRHPAKENGKLKWVMECGDKLGEKLASNFTMQTEEVDNNNRSPAVRQKCSFLSPALSSDTKERVSACNLNCFVLF